MEDLHAALDRVLDKNATPDLVPSGAMVLQPNEERRRSGSHYTPRELTEPIVRHTLFPILDRLRGEDGRAPTPEQILEIKICDPAMGSGAFLVETCRQLADALIDSWGAYGNMPDIPTDEDEVIYARRLVAQRCLYGIDRNPMAVDLAKVSLWLSTLARDHPLTFVDHAFRHGDSLVGLTRRQIDALHWKGGTRVLTGFGVREALDAVSDRRRQIRNAKETVTDRELKILWRDAKEALAEVRLFGDLVLSAFFEKSKPRDRESRRLAYREVIWSRKARHHATDLEDRRNAEVPFAPFHWEIEFPEVFDQENPGFDGFVGNPPFAGKNAVAASNIKGYLIWLKTLHEQSHGNADLVAHFYRRAFNLLRDGGAFGLIATNTIAQGDTRSSGLRWICKHGGKIYRVTKRVQWPGEAAVVVSVVHVAKGEFVGSRELDGASVDKITAFLFHQGGHDDPVRLAANAGKSFQGSIVLGMGFTFDDTDRKGVATPLAEMHRLVQENPRNGEVIFPYVGGQEVNNHRRHGHHRYVMNFWDYPLERTDLGTMWGMSDERQRAEWRAQGVAPLDYPHAVAEDWPDLIGIVRERVKPDRDRQNRKALRVRWWQYAEKRPGLYAAIEGLEQVLVISRVGQQASLAFLPAGMVYSESTVVFPLSTYAAFCALQSRPHDTWARFFGSSMKDDLRYTPSDCFETFPFPNGWQARLDLETAGKQYYEFRASLMVNRKEGMTKTYNRFHDPFENDRQIIQLRDLHDAMDRAVLDAYGWTDISTDCDFLLDYEIDDTTWGRRKKPYRYRWPDPVRDEVLARLLALNAERATEEEGVGAQISKFGRSRYRRAVATTLKVAESKTLWNAAD